MFLKKILFCFLQLFALGLFAQAPSLINYQGSARMANGIPLGNKTLAVKFDIHQNTANGTVVFTETEVLQTNLLGLFTTQIGKTSNLSSVNWGSGTMFLEVSIDTTGGTNFTSLGAQQMVSTPYAMHAQSVPATYVGNVLTVGSSSFALTPTMTAAPNTSITVSGLGTVTSPGTNTFDINIPAPTFTGLGTATVSGTYPTYTISSDVPTFTNTGQQIVTGAYPNFTVNTPTVAAVPDQTLTQSGLVTISNPVTNSFVIGVQSPTFTSLGTATVSGAYPNYTVNSDVPTFTNTGQPIIVGAYPNFTVNTPTVSAVPNQTITQSGLVTVSNPVTNSFVIGVQSPTFTNAGQNIITGTYPNFSVNTPTIPAAITPTIAVTTTAAANASVTSSGSSFNINVPPPAFTNSGPATITGTYPNYVINSTAVPNTSITVTSTAAAGPSVSTIGTNSFNINIPSSNDWALNGNAGTNPGSDFIGTTDGQDFRIRTNNSPRLSVTSSGNVGIGTIAPTEPFDVSGAEGHFVAHPYWVGPGATAVMASLNNTNAKSPQFRFNGGAGSYYDIGKNAAGNFAVENNFDSPLLTLNSVGALGLGNTSDFGTAGQVLTSGGSGAPATWQSPALGAWGLTGNAATNPATNFIGTTDAQALSFRTNNTLVADISSAGYMGLGSAPAFATSRLTLYGSENTTGLNAFSAAPGTAIRIHNNDLTNSNFSSLIFSSQASNFANFEAAKIVGQVTDHTTGSIAGELAFMTRSPGNLLEAMRIKSNGAVGIGTSLPNGNFHVHSQTTNHALTRLTSSLATTGLVTYIDGASAAITNYENTPLYFGVNVASRMSISSAGNVNIVTGVALAAEKLNVDGNISLEDATAGFAPNRVIGFPTATPGWHGSLTLQAKNCSFTGAAAGGGNLILAGGDYNVGSANPTGSYGGNVIITTGTNLWPHATGASITFLAGTNTTPERMRIDGANGRVGIGTTAPDQLLSVNGDASKLGGGSWATFSDRRLKKDIHSYKDGLTELLRIEPVWYTYNGEANLPQETFVGIIAQDLQEIAPYMVKETDVNGTGIPGKGYLSVNNSAMTYMIINAVKEQQKQIEDLKKTLEEQKKITEEQKKLIDQLLDK